VIELSKSNGLLHTQGRSAINNQFSPKNIKILAGEEVMRIKNIINKESLDHSKNTPN